MGSMSSILKSEIEFLIDNNIKDRGEYQLTNALENMKNKNYKFGAAEVREWLDCGNKDAKKQMKNYGGMLSFDLNNSSLTKAKEFVSKTHFFTLAESLGGVESLCGHPASMTHAAIPKQERLKSGVTDSLIRLSVGIEDINDLIYDLESTLKQVQI